MTSAHTIVSNNRVNACAEKWHSESLSVVKYVMLTIILIKMCHSNKYLAAKHVMANSGLW